MSMNKGLQLEEPLIFEQDSLGVCGVDWPEVDIDQTYLGSFTPRTQIGLPGLSEPDVVRHYTRLSQKNYAIDMGLYPLGSCTMKHNPRLNEKMARLPGIAYVHPLQPFSSVQGALGLMEHLSNWLLELTGMKAVALSPAAGAHGELCGMMAIHAALAARKDPRKIVLVAQSAHGTNPATAAACGYEVRSIATDPTGRVDVKDLASKLDHTVAAIMLTNPNTCGLFERDIIRIAELTHAVGAYFYCDGANFNAIMGWARPGDLGVDAMHLNLHKTFSTPHGGGGPGSGPVVFSAALADHVPSPYLVKTDQGLALEEHAGWGRLKGFHGQMGMFVRALTYMLSHGSDGLRQAAADAVLNANYILSGLKDDFSAPYEGLCMHEVLFDDRFLKNTGVSTLDFAKALIDEGFHPMTMYFPLIVSGAMLIEPTETEPKRNLDQFIAVMKDLVDKVKSGAVDHFTSAPIYTPRKRLDETLAARELKLRC